MRYSLSSVAILASSLLVTEVFAGRFDLRKRALYLETENVVVTEEVYVSEMADGSYETGTAAVAVGTATLQGSAVLVPETTSTAEPTSTSAATSSSVFVAAASSSIPEYVPATSSAATSTTQAAVFVQQAAPTTSSTSTTPEPTTSSTTPVVVPTTTAAPIIPTTSAAATTLATIVVPTTTSSAAPVATTASSTSGKRGVAFNDASLTDVFTSSSKVSWAYNWGSSSSSIASGLEYVPMLWGTNSASTTNWNSLATKAIAAGSSHLLGFNEPDLAAQSNIGYADAATGWMTYMEPFSGKAKLVSPAVTNGGSPMGLTWLENFITSCSDCTIDYIAIHWYNGGDAAAFKEYIAEAYAAGGNRQLWVTEFQASGTTAEQQAFLTEVMDWMDNSSMVARYAYFMASDGLLCTGSALSDLGNTFATA